MNSRQVAELLKGKVDPMAIQVFVAMAEDNSTRKQEIVELAKMIDVLATMMKSFVDVQADMAEKIKKMRGDKEGEYTPKAGETDVEG